MVGVRTPAPARTGALFSLDGAMVSERRQFDWYARALAWILRQTLRDRGFTTFSAAELGLAACVEWVVVVDDVRVLAQYHWGDEERLEGLWTRADTLAWP